MTGLDCIAALKALGEESRLRALRLLFKEQLGVTEISKRLRMSQYNVSKHLRIMREAGLLVVEKQGKQRLYTVAATLTGFPVSTTHGLTGAILGSGLVAVGTQVNFQSLGKGFLLPLLLSPVLAVVLAAPLYLFFRFLRLRFGITKEWCICVGNKQE